MQRIVETKNYRWKVGLYGFTKLCEQKFRAWNLNAMQAEITSVVKLSEMQVKLMLREHTENWL
jgi:hypothetical protein